VHACVCVCVGGYLCAEAGVCRGREGREYRGGSGHVCPSTTASGFTKPVYTVSSTRSRDVVAVYVRVCVRLCSYMCVCMCVCVCMYLYKCLRDFDSKAVVPSSPYFGAGPTDHVLNFK
jgi:hypothetical protein